MVVEKSVEGLEGRIYLRREEPECLALWLEGAGSVARRAVSDGTKSASAVWGDHSLGNL